MTLKTVGSGGQHVYCELSDTQKSRPCHLSGLTSQTHGQGWSSHGQESRLTGPRHCAPRCRHGPWGSSGVSPERETAGGRGEQVMPSDTPLPIN